MTDSSTFFSTAAQVLPLFVLALAAERRLGRSNSKDRGDQAVDLVLGLMVVTFAAIGEFASLQALTGHPSKGQLQTAQLSLGIAGLFLYADLVWQQVHAYNAGEPSRLRRWAMSGLASALVGVGALLLGAFWLSLL